MSFIDVTMQLLDGFKATMIIFFVNEPKLAKKQQEYEAAHPEENLTKTDANNKSTMPKPVKRSLIFLIKRLC